MLLAILFILLFLSIILLLNFKGFIETSSLVEMVNSMMKISAEPNPWLVLSIGLAVFAWRIYSDSRKWKYEKSGFNLTSALDAFEEAHKLLDDGNNDRVTWISAARALKRGKNIADGLTEQVHRDVLELQLDRYRIKFGAILGCDDEDKDETFFKGDTFFETGEEPVLKSGRNIPPSTLKVIWDLAQFPPEYEDPIPFGKSFSDAEIDSGVNNVRYKGLFKYLQTCRKPH